MAQKQLWEQGDWNMALSRRSRLFKQPSSSPARNAKVELLDRKGNVVDERKLEKPLARLTESSIHDAGARAFLLTVDLSAGSGSYNGPLTTLLYASRTGLQEIKAFDASTHEPETIALAKTWKSRWKIVQLGEKTEILSFSCYPDWRNKEDNHFLVRYRRYSFESNQWIKYEREEPGYWEADEPFPPRSKFP